jgi:hypothetical protein
MIAVRRARRRRAVAIGVGVCLVVVAALVGVYLLSGDSAQQAAVGEPTQTVVALQGAHTATMNLSPSTGTFAAGTTLTVKLVIDGGGQAFNAAQATVRVSGSARLLSVAPGNCGFSFVPTPTAAAPRVFAAILGGSSKGCTVYALLLQVTGTQPFAITLSNAEVLARAPGAPEILSRVISGSYN